MYIKSIVRNTLVFSTILYNSASNAAIADLFDTSDFNVYFKAFAGNTGASSRYETNRHGVDPADPVNTYALTEYKKVNMVNLPTPGLALGISRPLALMSAVTNLTLGIEASLQRQLEGYTFDSDPDAAETTVDIGDSEQLKINIDNKFKSTVSAVLGIADLFYIKLGPTLMRQKVTTTLFATNAPKKAANFHSSDTKNIFGINLGSGVKYNLTKSISFFTEYNFSHFFQKDISDFAYQPHLLSDGALFVTTYNINDTRIKYSQSEFFVGVQVATA